MNLPKAFEERMREVLKTEFQLFQQSLDKEAPVSIRLNPRKFNSQNNLVGVEWCEQGRYLEKRPSFTLDPNFHAGAYYVQEASSMFLEQAVKQSIDLTKPIRALDLCAAPGGKSTHLLSLVSRESLLVSNEVIRSRASILSENIQKWGYANAVVTNSDPEDFKDLNGFFDLIVVDAPCSGEGLFRKDPEAMNEWSEENGNLCSLRQRRILTDVWPALKENGILIFCTCTYNEKENEENLEWLSVQRNTEFIRLKDFHSGIQAVESDGVIGYRFLPHHVQGEGFFISVIRKCDPESSYSQKKFKSEILSKRETDRVSQWLHGDFNFIKRDNLLIALPSATSQDIGFIGKHLKVVSRGIAIATPKHDKLIPEHALALSVDLAKKEFPIIDLSLEQALRYLRRENIHLESGEKGFALVQFENNSLGWVNSLGNRTNNLYPSNWRIRMA